MDYVARLYLVLDYREHGGRLPFGAAVLVLARQLDDLPVRARLPRHRSSSPTAGSRRAGGSSVGLRRRCSRLRGDAADRPGSSTRPRGLGHVDIRGNLPNGSGGSVANWSWPLALFFLGAWIAFVWRQVAAWRSASGVRRAQLKWLAGGQRDLRRLGRRDRDARRRLLRRALASPPTWRRSGSASCRSRSAWRSSATGCTRSTGSISRTLSYARPDGAARGGRSRGSCCSRRACCRSRRRSRSPCRRSRPRRSSIRCGRRVQRLVDRRFNRARYDRDALVARVRGEACGTRSTRRRSSPSSRARPRAAVEPAHISVWVRDRSSPLDELPDLRLARGRPRRSRRRSRPRT